MEVELHWITISQDWTVAASFSGTSLHHCQLRHFFSPCYSWALALEIMLVVTVQVLSFEGKLTWWIGSWQRILGETVPYFVPVLLHQTHQILLLFKFCLQIISHQSDIIILLHPYIAVDRVDFLLPSWLDCYGISNLGESAAGTYNGDHILPFLARLCSDQISKFFSKFILFLLRFPTSEFSCPAWYYLLNTILYSTLSKILTWVPPVQCCSCSTFPPVWSLLMFYLEIPHSGHTPCQRDSCPGCSQMT